VRFPNQDLGSAELDLELLAERYKDLRRSLKLSEQRGAASLASCAAAEQRTATAEQRAAAAEKDLAEAEKVIKRDIQVRTAPPSVLLLSSLLAH
jgi:hypothetical protein